MDNDRRSLTPCLDENAVEQNAKSLSDLSDISDEDEKNWDELQKNESNKNGKDPNDLFKKITKKARERNYRDKAAAPPVAKNQRDVSGDRTKRSQKRSEIQRYDVRSVIRDGREFSFSKSRSRSRSPANRISHHKKVLRSPLRNRHNSDSSRRYSRRHSRSPTPKYNDRNSSDKINRKSRYSSNYRKFSI
jgi:PHD and RING finger domain-containing protein 1